MMLRTLAVALVAIVGLAAVTALMPADASSTSVDCAPFYLDGIGMACPAGPGLYRMIGPGGRDMGTTHGMDVAVDKDGSRPGCLVLGVQVNAGGAGGVPPPCPTEPELERVPYCVDGNPGERYTKIVYARSFDDYQTTGHQVNVVEYMTDGALLDPRLSTGHYGWQYTDDEVRSLVNVVNRKVYDAGMANGLEADIRVECDMGKVKVNRLTLWTPRDLVDFMGIKQELQDHFGYTDPLVKYMVLYDHAGPSGCGGVADFEDDHTPSAANLNNGNTPLGQIAVTWDCGWPYWSTGPAIHKLQTWRVLAHEWGHTVGAVQNNLPGTFRNPLADAPPHATGSAHCWDKLDIMCYEDSGCGPVPNAGWAARNGHEPPPLPNFTRGCLYPAAPMTCTSYVWDCSRDDYFNVNPAAGNWLATHWNIGAPYQGYVARDSSTMEYLVCSSEMAWATGPTVPGVPLVCRFRGGNPGAGTVTYRVDWGDSSPPTTVSGGAGAEANARYTYPSTAVGNRVIHVTAQDPMATNPSGAMPWKVKVQPGELEDDNDEVDVFG